MERIIIITPDELREIIEDVFENKIKIENKESTLSDTMSLDTAIQFLKENGFNISKPLIYKLTSKNQIPYSKWYNKLIFSRKNLLEWANSHLVDITLNDESIQKTIKSALKKNI